SDWTHLLLDEAAAERFERGAEVRTVAVVHGQIWAGSQLGVFRWDADSEQLLRVEFEEEPDRPMPRINAILESRNGGIWVGAHDGLYRIDEQAMRFVQLNDGYHLIPDVDIRSLFEDSEGNLWIGSRDRGIIRGQRHDSVFSPLADQAPLALADEASRLTSAVLHDRAGKLWLGIPGGLLRQDRQGRWSAWEFPAEAGVRRVEGLAQGADETVWIATDSGLFRIGEDDRLQADERLFQALGIAAVPVNAILADADQSLWLGLWNFGVVRWNPETGQIDTGVEALREIRADLVYQLNRDASGAIWAATRYAGVFRFGHDGWQRVPIQLNNRQHAPSFYCVHHQPPGTLWLCTEDGLVRYRLETGEAEIYGSAHGLPTQQITGLIKDDDEDFWVLTSRGVARRMPNRNRFVSYGLADGLPGLAVQRNALDKSPEGQIVIGTSNGAASLDPDSLTRGLNAPRAVLSRVWLDGEELTRSINPDRLQLTLPADHRDLLMQFAVLDFHEPERNLARMRLRGYEPSFSELTSNRELRYMNLPPGDYVLEVEGWSSRGVPGEAPLEIPIQVAAPWWHSPLAWVAAVLLLGGLIWLLIRLRLRALSRSNNRLQALIEERTRDLEVANEQLKARSARDFLTGLLNRRGFTERFKTLQHMSVRANTSMAVVLFDLDHFKQINDSYGHDIGDETLRTIGQVLRQSLRSQDLAARWGGEEFLLALPDTEAAGALQVCEKIRSSLADAHPRSQTGRAHKVSATFGVVAKKGCGQPLEAWVKAADRALYRGKHNGRDQIQIDNGDDL
ncbi:MAG: diguanylate cyclase, partial [Wenzhouxiangella sp.]